jgi:hypothetical protein
MNPLTVATGLAFIVISVSSFLYGASVGEDREYAKRAREDKIVADSRAVMSTVAAEAIAKNRPINTTIRQEVEREIKTDTRYVDCALTDGVFDNANAALTGRKPAGDRKLPRTKPPGG